MDISDKIKPTLITVAVIVVFLIAYKLVKSALPASLQASLTNYVL